MKRRVMKKRRSRLLRGDRWFYVWRRGRHDRWSVAGLELVAQADAARRWMEREMVRAMVADLARFIDAVEAARCGAST